MLDSSAIFDYNTLGYMKIGVLPGDEGYYDGRKEEYPDLRRSQKI